MSAYLHDVSGATTIEIDRPLPLVTAEPDMAWVMLSVEVEVEVSRGEVAGATLVGSMTRVVLTEVEERRAIEHVEDHYDPDDHYRDDAFEEARCERSREAMEAME